MPKRTDDNQAEIMDALRKCGAVVHSTHEVADGFPDLVVLWQGEILLMEVKDGRKVPSKQKLTGDQVLFHNKWKEARRLYIVNSVDNAIKALNGKL